MVLAAILCTLPWEDPPRLAAWAQLHPANGITSPSRALESPEPELALPLSPHLLPESITLHDHHITVGNYRLEGLSVTLRFEILDEELKITVTGGTLSAVRRTDGESHSPPLFQNVTFQGAFSWSSGEERFRLSEFHVRVPPEGVISLEGEYDPSKSAGRARVTCNRLDLSLTVVQGLSLPDDFHVAFLLDSLIDLEQKSGGPLVWKASGSTKDLGFHSPDFLHAGEKLHAAFQFSGLHELPGSTTFAEGRLQITRGEWLFDKFYLDLARTPFRLDMSVNLSQGALPFLRIQNLQVAVGSILKLRSKGVLDWGGDAHRTDLEIVADRQPLEPLFRKFFQEPLSETLPGLDRLSLAGDWEGRLRVHGPVSDPAFEGRIELHDGDLFHEAGTLRVRDISMSVPFLVTPSGKTEAPQRNASLEGHLQVGEMTTPFLHLTAFRVPLSASPNGYRITERVILQAEKGTIELLEFNLEDFPDVQRKGRLALSISQLALDNFLRALFTEELAATLSTERLNIQIEGDRLESSGPLHLDTFAGPVIIERFGMEQAFSPFRKFTLDAHWKNLDLDKLTLLTDFGRVTGHVEGHLKGLEITAATPVAFDLLIHSAPKRRETRKISVTAVENLTELSGGGSPFRGAAGLMASIFKTFCYEEIGIACYLRNDFFTIRGTVIRRDTEYLVRRGRLGGINIINRNPDNRISWNDMLRRIQRIKRESSPETAF